MPNIEDVFADIEGLEGPTDREEKIAPHISHTQIDAFLKCRRKWFYSYVLGIKTPAGMNLVYGNALHETIEHVNNKWRDAWVAGEKQIPDGYETLSGKMIPWEKLFAPLFAKKVLEESLNGSEELLAYLKPVTTGMKEENIRALIKQTLDGTDNYDLTGERMNFLPEETLGEMLKMGRDHVKEFLLTARGSRRWYPWKVEEWLEVYEEDLGVNFVGRVDLIEINKDEKLRLKDYKTSSKRYGPGKGASNFLQLQLYSLLTGIRNAAFEIFVKTKKPQLQTSRKDGYLETFYSDYDLSLASGRIKMIVQEMLRLKGLYEEDPENHKIFSPVNPYDNWACTDAWCPYFGQCKKDCVKSSLNLKIKEELDNATKRT